MSDKEKHLRRKESQMRQMHKVHRNNIMGMPPRRTLQNAASSAFTYDAPIANNIIRQLSFRQG